MALHGCCSLLFQLFGGRDTAQAKQAVGTVNMEYITVYIAKPVLGIAMWCF